MKDSHDTSHGRLIYKAHVGCHALLANTGLQFFLGSTGYFFGLRDATRKKKPLLGFFFGFSSEPKKTLWKVFFWVQMSIFLGSKVFFRVQSGIFSFRVLFWVQPGIFLVCWPTARARFFFGLRFLTCIIAARAAPRPMVWSVTKVSGSKPCRHVSLARWIARETS